MSTDAPSTRRARAAHGPDWIALRIRERRVALRLSYGALARKARLRAPSHILHIEKGDKVPSEAIAVRLARALGEDVELFRAWSRARSRTDLATALAAAETLRRWAGGPSPAAGASPAGPDAATASAGGPGGATASAAAASGLRAPPEAAARAATVRVRIPLFPEGADPDRARTETHLRMEPAVVAPPDQLRKPFAWAIAERHPLLDLARGDHLVFTREVLPLVDEAPHLVRTGEGIALGRVRWDGATLMLLEGPASPPRTFAVPSGGLASRLLARAVLAMRRWERP